MVDTLAYEELEQKVKELAEEAAKDVSKQESAEYELHEPEEMWRSLAETAPCVILMVQRDGTIQFLNRTVGDYSPGGTIGTKVWDYLPPDRHSLVREAMEHVFQTGSSTSYEILAAGPDGPASAWYMTQLGPIVRDGRVVALTMVSTDITELKKIEEALRRSEARYRDLVEKEKDIIYTLDKEGRITSSNPAVKALGYHPKQVIGKNFADFTSPEALEKTIKDFNTLLKTGEITAETVLLDKQGNPRFFEYSSTAIKEDGKVVGTRGIIRDITERKRAGQALREREAELKDKTHRLEEVNAALRVLLQQRDGDRRELEEKVLFNIKELVVPYLEALKKSNLAPKQLTYLGILESNLNDIISPFSRTLSSNLVNLTPTEIRVGNLVKEGKTSQEIAEVMCISPRTVETHRDRIRKKLGLKNRKANLRSHLLSI